MRRRSALLALLAGAPPASAHSPLPGIDGFYRGLVHPITTSDQVIALVAVGLLFGERGLRRLPSAAWLLGGGLLLGLALGSRDPAPALYGLAAAVGGLSALAPARAAALAPAVAAMAGVLLGMAAVPEAGPARDRLVTMAGSFVGVALLSLYIAGFVDLARSRLDHPALIIGLRIAAAWVAAMAMMMLALSLAQ